MGTQAMSLGRSERSGSISASVAKLFSLSRERDAASPRLAFQELLEEPEVPIGSSHSQPNIAEGIFLAKRSAVRDARQSFSFTKLQQAERRRLDLQSSGAGRERKLIQKPLARGNSLENHYVGNSSLKAKSLLESPERQNIAFKQYSLPNEPVAGPSVDNLLPLNQEYPSLAEFKVLRTIGQTLTEYAQQMSWLPSPPSSFPQKCIGLVGVLWSTLSHCP